MVSDNFPQCPGRLTDSRYTGRYQNPSHSCFFPVPTQTQRLCSSLISCQLVPGRKKIKKGVFVFFFLLCSWNCLAVGREVPVPEQRLHIWKSRSTSDCCGSRWPLMWVSRVWLYDCSPTVASGGNLGRSRLE